MSLSLAGLSNHATKSYNHCARGDYNAELLSALKIILNTDKHCYNQGK